MTPPAAPRGRGSCRAGSAGFPCRHGGGYNIPMAPIPHPDQVPQRPGKIVVISGPSGVGKTTILRRVLHDLPQLMPSISATTRPPRAGERDGVDYHFLSPAEFERRREAGEFLECCRVYGRQHWYGTLASEVDPRIAAGDWVVLEIDVEGTLSILERYPAAVTIFVEPAVPEQLGERLRGRGTESPDAMARRLEVAHRELREAHRYRHRVVNDDIDAAVAAIEGILNAAGLPAARSSAPKPSPAAHQQPIRSTESRSVSSEEPVHDRRPA
jgi:guanylate kinase